MTRAIARPARARIRLASQWPVLLAGVTLGLLLSFAWKAPPASHPPAVSPQAGRILLSVERLEAEQQQLKATLAELRREVDALQQAAASGTDRSQALKAELERQRWLAGLTPVEGPGVAVTLDDSPEPLPPGANAGLYLVHEYDLRDVVNLLWMAGAEAIAINGERLVGTSSIYCAGSTVMVNNTRLSPPYQIQAIGNPRVLQNHLRNPSYLPELKEKQRSYGLRFEFRSNPHLVLPPYSGSVLIPHAGAGE